jgi:MoaA/NifB/PqqE/SkfB family radical SAM enzyme
MPVKKFKNRIPIRSIEWLVTENCNYTCGYCALYNNKIKPLRDIKLIKEFLIMIARKQVIYDFTFFVFGGEPFLHPLIKDIIVIMNDLDIDYVLQTNLSNKSLSRIKDILEDKIEIQGINISVHFSQQSLPQYIENIKKITELPVDVKAIDVMYDGIYNIELYRNLRKALDNRLIYLIPVSDFLVTGFADHIREFNTLVNNPEYSDIAFESFFMAHPITGKDTERRIVWEEFVNKVWSPKGKVCLMKKSFQKYDSNLKLYNCCFAARDYIDDPYICPYDECFLS